MATINRETIRPHPETYPFNLIRVIYNDNAYDHTHTDRIFLKAFYEEIGKLEPKQKKFIEQHYRDHIPKYKCAEKMRLSISHLQDFETRIYSTLKNPTVAKNYMAIPEADAQASREQKDQLVAENKLLKDILRELTNRSVAPSNIEIEDIVLTPNDENENNRYNQPIEILNLSNGAYNACKQNKLHTIKDINACGRDGLRLLNRMGVKTIHEIINTLDENGYSIDKELTQKPQFNANALLDYKNGKTDTIHLQFTTPT